MSMSRVISVVSIVSLMIVIFIPTITDAATQASAIDVSVYSKRSASLDREFNAADRELSTDYGAWQEDWGDHLSEGVFYGGNFEPSVLSVDDSVVVGETTNIAYKQMLYFPSDVVMSGMYDFWVRAPVYYDNPQWTFNNSLSIILINNRSVWTTHDHPTSPGENMVSDFVTINGRSYVRLNLIIHPNTWYEFTFVVRMLNEGRRDAPRYAPMFLATTENVGFTSGSCRYSPQFKLDDQFNTTWQELPNDGSYYLNFATSFLFRKSVGIDNVVMNSNTITNDTKVVQINTYQYIDNSSALQKGNLSIYLPFVCEKDVFLKRVDILRMSGNIRLNIAVPQNYWTWNTTSNSFSYRDFILFSAGPHISFPSAGNNRSILSLSITLEVNITGDEETSLGFLGYERYPIIDLPLPNLPGAHRDAQAAYHAPYRAVLGGVADENVTGWYALTFGSDTNAITSIIESDYPFQFIVYDFSLKMDMKLTAGQWTYVMWDSAVGGLSYSHVIRTRLVLTVLRTTLIVNGGERTLVEDKVFEDRDEAVRYMYDLDYDFRTKTTDDPDTHEEDVWLWLKNALNGMAGALTSIAGFIVDGIDFLWQGIQAVFSFIYDVAMKFVGVITGILEFLEANWMIIFELVIFMSGLIIALVALKLISKGMLGVATR